MDFTLSIDLSKIPFFFILFFIVLPAYIYFLRGGFWVLVYIFFSSLGGALFSYYAPLGFIEMVLPEALPDFVKNYFELLFRAVMNWSLLLFSAMVFFMLLLFQYGLLKLLSFFRWGGIKDIAD